MEIHLFKSKSDMGTAAAVRATRLLNAAIQAAGEANIVLATGASQFEMLSALLAEDVDWSKVSAFHLDEYIGLIPTHYWPCRPRTWKLFSTAKGLICRKLP